MFLMLKRRYILCTDEVDWIYNLVLLLFQVVVEKLFCVSMSEMMSPPEKEHVHQCNSFKFIVCNDVDD